MKKPLNQEEMDQLLKMREIIRNENSDEQTTPQSKSDDSQSSKAQAKGPTRGRPPQSRADTPTNQVAASSANGGQVSKDTKNARREVNEPKNEDYDDSKAIRAGSPPMNVIVNFFIGNLNFAAVFALFKNYQQNVMNYIPVSMQSTFTEMKKIYRGAQRVIPQVNAKKATEETAIFGIMTLGMFMSILVCGGITGFIMDFLINHMKIPMPLFQTLAILVTCLGAHYQLKFHERAVIGSTLLVTIMVFMINPDDNYVTSKPDRMNMHFYQEMDRLMDSQKQGTSIMHLLFTGRKVLDSCNLDPTSATCYYDLKEFELIKNISMSALISVMRQPEIVTPRNVELREQESMDSHSVAKHEINFAKTVSVYPNDRATRSQVNEYEIKLCALAALRLQDGMTYFKNFTDFLQVQKSSYAAVEYVYGWAMASGPFDRFIFGEYAVVINKIKIALSVIYQMFQRFIVQKWTVESFTKNMNYEHIFESFSKNIDYCLVQRCYPAELPPRTLPATNDNSHKNTDFENSSNLTHGVFCPSGDYNLSFDFFECDFMRGKCFDALETYNNNIGDVLKRMCPTKCRNIVYKEVEKPSNNSCIKPSSGKGSFDIYVPQTSLNKACTPRAEECTSVLCMTRKIVLDANEYMIRFIMTGGLMFIQGYYQIRYT
jgi:hypothetical protein